MREQLNLVMIRRLKSDMQGWDEAPRFPVRVLNALPVSYSEQEQTVHRLLRDYTESRLQHSLDEEERFASEFVLKLLKKRLFSSPQAFATTLRQHEETLLNARKRDRSSTGPAIGILRRQVEQLDEESDNDTTLEEAMGTAVEIAAPLFRPPTPQEQQWLHAMRAWADEAGNRSDSKAQELIRWLHAQIKPAGTWSDQRVIIFTEYRATLSSLQELLSSEGFASHGRLLTLYGGMNSEEREQIKAAFQADPAVSAVRILLATDAASEGIDLQNYCSRLIHYEIPWNPNRLEQRNGRIDRHGQLADEVKIYHFVGSKYHLSPADAHLPTGELDGDLEFLWRALLKVDQIRQDLGKVGSVIAAQVEEAMFTRRTRLDTRFVEEKADPLRRWLKFERRLRDQIADLHQRLLESKRTLGLTPAHIQAVVETALAIAGKPPLRKVLFPAHNGRAPLTVFYLPELTDSWSICKEGLLHPFSREERPIVFDHELAAGRDDVVLAHLNHRLVAMSLRLLRAAIWDQNVQRHLHRVTARTVPNSELATPAVIAHARLVVLGTDSQRLHEELIFAGGYLREGRFTRMNLTDAQRLLQAAHTRPVSAQTQQHLRVLWPNHFRSLQQALEGRMRDRVGSLQRFLDESKQKEIADITMILQELRTSIMQELDQPEVLQLELFTSDERRQLDSNKKALVERASQIQEEIAEETARIEQRFADPQSRLFPVAVTYLVPERLAQ